MGKETKEMLKAILHNTELIIDHLKISKPATKETKKPAENKKVPVKKSVTKK